MNISRKQLGLVLCFTVVLALGAAGCGSNITTKATGEDSAGGSVPQPTLADLRAGGLDELPFAPDSRRVDLNMPEFSHPTRVTNPLFPISDLHSAVLSGRVDGKWFHTETTLLPETRVIQWPKGRYVETLVSQYVAFLDGRIQEVATDYYAQADDGSVWYLGEHVTDFDNGIPVTHEGTWIASPTRQAAMIMPSAPQVGDVFRVENLPGLAFEEVTVKERNVTIDGPGGPVHGGIIGLELKGDGGTDEKLLSPGYGEFRTASEGDVEEMALAVPIDALKGDPPAQLQAIADAAGEAFSQIQAGSWEEAQRSAATATAAWKVYPADAKPPLIAVEMDRALLRASQSVNKRNRTAASLAALTLARSGLDLRLRYSRVTEVDLGRFTTWLRQARVDNDAGDTGPLAGDITVLELIRARFPHVLESHELVAVDAQLAELRAAAVDGEQAAVTEAVDELLDTMSGIEPGPARNA